MKHISTITRIIFFALFIALIHKGKMMLWFGIYALGLVLALVFGRIYCGYACPMNTLMIPTEWLSKKLKIQTNKTPKWLQSGKIAWIALFGSLAIILFARRVLKKNIPILLIWLGISVLVTLRYKPHVFHNLLCPFGILQKIFGSSPIFSKRVIADGCIGCKRCEKVCPTEAIIVNKEDKKATIVNSMCLQCVNCVQICPTNAIKYSKKTTESQPHNSDYEL